MKQEEGRSYFGDLGLDGNMILKEMLKKYFVVVLAALF